MIVELIREWLTAQEPFALDAAYKTNSPESVNRRRVMQNLRTALEAGLADNQIIINGEPIVIGMSAGQGIDTAVPYLSFSRATTPNSVTRGWSVGIMAQQGATGIAFYIGLGVYNGAKKKARKTYTDRVIQDNRIPEKFRNRLDIGFGGLANSYAASTPLSFDFDLEKLKTLSDKTFFSELKEFVAQYEFVLENYSDYPLREDEVATDGGQVSGIDEAEKEGVFRTLSWTGLFLKGRPGEKFIAGEIAEALVQAHPVEAEQKRLASKQGLSEAGLVKQVEAEVSSRVSTGNLTKKFPQVRVTDDVPRKMYWEPAADAATYGVSAIQAEGSFLNAAELDQTLGILRSKKNIILQGPPGTGKTWLAKRLAYALMGEKAPERIVSLQFHSNMSYEDFVRGWRPMGDGKLSLVDGPFLELVETAQQNPDLDYALVIEELNRGNPAQIFGEILTLVEANKRSEDNALRLTYPRSRDELVFVPENLYVIGTMNMADKSLALMDFAFRRRFGFISLEPKFNEAWSAWLTKLGVNRATSSRIRAALDQLNSAISNDPNLGSAYAIGHSFFTPNEVISSTETWLSAVVNSEIEPALREYWFDDPITVENELGKIRTQLFG